MTCVYCDGTLEGRGARPAFDPWLGRLWRVCPSCGRWNVVPLEDRWETLEALERRVRDDGTSLLRTPHLDLIRTGGAEVIRVGRAPRPELAGWRYGEALPRPPSGRRGWLRRLLLALPSAPHGFDTSEIGSLNYPFETGRWFASPFIEDAPGLTALFSHVPLASRCPACARPLALAPWQFAAIRVVGSAGGPAVAAMCGACGTAVEVPLRDARPVLRLGLSLVNRRLGAAREVEQAAASVDAARGPEGLLNRLAATAAMVGESGPETRLALQIALDEAAESELLEAEWREGEELAALVDGVLTPSPALEALRGTDGE